MKQKLNIMALMAIVMTMLFSQTAKAQKVMYTIYNSSEKTMTFYYREKPEPGTNETVYDVPTENIRPNWASPNNKYLIETVVFDSSFDKARPTSCSYWFYFCWRFKTIKGLENLHTDNVKYMNSMFYNCSIEELDLKGFKTDNVIDMQYMFALCPYLKSLDLTSFNTKEVTNISHMFDSCDGLTELKLSEFNTEKVEIMSYMFSGCSALKSLNLSSFNTTNVTDMRYMFSDCKELTYLDLSNFNTEKVEIMTKMFSGCSGLTSLNLSSFNAAKVKDMSDMFSNCSALESESLNLPENFNTDAVTNMAGLFSGCSKLTSLDLSNFNTDAVTDMSGLFYNCSSLESLNLSSFNTAKVTKMSNMFFGCSSLTSLDLSNFNTEEVTNMSGLFSGCSKLTSLDLSNFNTDLVTNMSYMFDGSSALKTIYVSDKFVTDQVTSSDNMFRNCTNLVGAEQFSSGHIDKTYANYNDGYFKTYCKVGETKVEMWGNPLKCENLTLTDGQDFVAHSPFTATNVYYTRTISTTAPKWGSLCLPFEYTPSDLGFEAYQLTSSDDANNTITLEKIEGPIDAGTPVLFKNPTERTSLDINATGANIVPVEGTATKIGNLKLVGTYQAKTFTTDDNNCFILKDDKLMNPARLLLTNTNVTKVGLNAYRAYMVNETSSSTAPQTYSIETGEGTTVINSLNIMTGEGAEYYDMTGCRTNGLKKGLNIVRQGGKTMKIIIK